MKYKFKSSNFDKQTGIATVVISASGFGEFTGIARTCPEDMAHMSEFFGCNCAELRAYLKLLKAKLKKAKTEDKVLQNVLKSVNEQKYFNRFDITTKALMRQIEDIAYSIKQLQTEIAIVKKSIQDAIAARDKVTGILDKWSKLDNHN